ncbi:hypothetical protein [Psychromonas arctica]|uniref:hypothetical protein n=1 Tax=Psychromonas arctica TaxID=168275 RepID=UPI002FD32DF1
MDIRQHHNKNHWLNEKKQRSEYLLSRIDNANETSKKVFTKESIQHAAPLRLDHYWDLFTKAVMLGWPKTHCMWLLYQTTDFGRMHFRMHLSPNRLTPVELASELVILTPTPVGKHHYSSDHTWLDAAIAATLCKESFIVDELQAYPIHFLDEAAGVHRNFEVHKAFFHFYKLFYSNTHDKQQQTDALRAVMQYAEHGKIEQLTSIEAEVSFHFLEYSVVSVIASMWKLQRSSLSDATTEAIKASYEYYADLLPREPGEPVGKDSMGLYRGSAMLLRRLLGVLALHYQTTGKVPEFESDYIPSWLIKGEIPSRQEVLFDNPPEFTLAGIGL